MTQPVRFLPQARQEAIETRNWYERRQPGLGALFAQALAEAIGRVQTQPLQFPLVMEQVRRAILLRFPYAVYFRIEPSEIIVMAVHGRQDPRSWQQRS